MARNKGSANLAASLEVLAGAPLDAREVVQAKADLTAAASFPYKYIGMEVYVVAENKKYRLIANDPTDLSNWEEIGSGSGESIQVDVLPSPEPEKIGSVLQFIGTTTSDYTHNFFYECVASEVEPVGSEDPSSEGWYELVSGEYVLSTDTTVDAGKTYYEIVWQQSNVQPVPDDVLKVGILPIPSAEYVGKQLMYIGSTQNRYGYVHGGIYECQQIAAQGQTAYLWVRINGERFYAGFFIKSENIFVDNWNSSALIPKVDGSFYYDISSGAIYTYYANDDSFELVILGVNTLNIGEAEFSSLDMYNLWAHGEGRYINVSPTTSDYTQNYFFAVEPSEIEPVGSEDPSALKWYEYDSSNDDYYVSEDTTVDGSKTYYEFKFVNINVQPSSGGGGALTKQITAAIDVGGIDSGTVYPVDTPIENILSDLLEPTLYPTLTNPSASLTYGASTYYAVGGTVSALSATLALNRGSISPAYGTSGYRSGAATNYAIATSGADTEYSDSSASSGSFSVPALTRASKGTIVVTGTVSYAAGEQPKDSKGGDYSTPLAAGNVSASKTLTFIQPYYYGISNTSSISDFTGLTENVTAKGQKTFSYTTNNQYMVMAYDSSYGDIRTILDGNGFDVTGGWTKSTLTVDGFSYYVYIANAPTTDTNAPFTFKY